MTRFAFLMALAMTISGCESTGNSRHSAGDSGLLPEDTSYPNPKADWVDNDNDGSTDGAVNNEGIEEFDATVASDDDTDSETPVSCPQIDLPTQLRDQDTGDIATLTRITRDSKCGVHLTCGFFDGDLWGDASPFTAEPDIFDAIITFSRESDGKWKLLDSLVGEEYASVFIPL